MRNIKGICYIIAACKEQLNKVSIPRNKDDLIIAADGGYDILNELSISPDIVLGDFDSIENIPIHENLIKHPTEKDDTDTLLSFKLGLKKGYKNFVIYGGIGGRIDHTVANIRTLSEMAENNARGFLVGNNTIITVIKDNKLIFSPNTKGYLSVFACGESAKGLSIKGFKYNADNIDLPYSSSLCVSNEFIGKEGEISVNAGKILVIWYEDEENFINNISSFII